MIPGFWAPTDATWGVENRTTALRVIPGSPKSQRVEYRVAAILAGEPEDHLAGLHDFAGLAGGLEKRAADLGPDAVGVVDLNASVADNLRAYPEPRRPLVVAADGVGVPAADPRMKILSRPLPS